MAANAILRSAVFFVFLCALISSQQNPVKPAMALPVRQANAVCGTCHQKIFQNYLDTPMANASGLATDRMFTGSFHHAPSGIDYKVSHEDNSLWLSFSRQGDQAVQGRHQLQYFLGSGHLGITYLFSVNGYFLESPVAYYANSKTFDMKPGLTRFPTLPSALPMTSGCMRCHMSGVQKEDAGSRNHFSKLPFLHAGITCESCHGDTAQHVQTSGKARVVNPMKLDAERRDSVCISCHLEGDTRIEHAGQNALGYKPGERIADYVSYFVYDNNEITSRGVSEIEELLESKCKKISGDRMSCMSCHDPHYSPPESERASFYRKKCLTCHSDPKFAAGHFIDSPDCAGCHMPKGQAEKVPHIAWTDHRIRQRYDQRETAFDSTTRPSLVPFLQDKADPRDLALAYYDLVAGGNMGEAQRAANLLDAALRDHPADLPLLTASGYLAQLKNETSRAIDMYERALAVDPVDPTASNNLAILLAKTRKLKEAKSLWEKTFALNQSTDEIGINLSAIDCMLGDRDAAISTLRRVLFYSPDRNIARQRLESIQLGQEKCAPPPASN